MSAHANVKRLQVIVVSFPIFVGTSYVLYKRMVLGEEQRKFKRAGENTEPQTLLSKPARMRDVVDTIEGKTTNAHDSPRPS